MRFERHASLCSLIVPAACGVCSCLARRVRELVQAHLRDNRAVWIMSCTSSDGSCRFVNVMLNTVQAVPGAAQECSLGQVTLYCFMSL
jgi:hypothetical protein